MSELALRLIAENKKTKATTLDLGNCGLTELPRELADCVWIDELILSNSWSEYDFEKRDWQEKKSVNGGLENRLISIVGIENLREIKKLVIAGEKGKDWPLTNLEPLTGLGHMNHLICYYTQVDNLSFIKELFELEKIDFDYTKVTDLTALKNLENLVQVNLQKSQISDINPLKNLKALKHLNISTTQVSDLSPLANLTALQTLYISATQVSDLSPLVNLTALQELSVSTTQVSDLSPLANLTALQILYVDTTQVSDLSPLATLTALQELYVSTTQVSDLSPLINLTALQILDVSTTQVGDLSPLVNLTALQTLSVSTTQVSDLSPLANLTALQILYVYSTQVSDLSPLATLIALQKLYVYSTQVSDLSPLANLTALQILYVYSTQVSDLSPLINLTALQELSVSTTQVSDLSPLANLTALQILFVYSTQVSDLSPLINLTALQKLSVHTTQVSDLSPLANLTTLQILDVSITQVSDLSPLLNLTTLQELSVSTTQVNDLSPLANLTALQKLYVHTTQVSDLSPLINLTTLQILDVSITQVSDLSPLANLTALQKLYVHATQVNDLSPLVNLTALQILSVHTTQVSDLSLLVNLTALQELSVNSTQVSDLSPLVNLTALQKLYVHTTQVSDLSPLVNLTALQELSVNSTQVSDLSPLVNLTALQKLYVYSTQVSDLSPLVNLTALQELYVYSTQVSDLSPLVNSTALQKLYVHTTQVSDLSPLVNLTALQELYVHTTQVSDLSPLANLTALQELFVHTTQVNDLSPLINLTALQKLSGRTTQVSDLSPLINLTALQILDVSITQVSDLSPLINLTTLQELYVSTTQVSDLSPLANLTTLQTLSISSTQVNDLSPLVNLTVLQKLDVSSTQSSNLSPLSNLIALQNLDVSFTKISDLLPLKELISKGVPVKWEKSASPESQGIFLKGILLDKPFVAAIKAGNEATLKYLNKPKEQLWEARVLVLGEPRAGKTTLRHKLKSPNASMPTEAESTKGIEIDVETYKCKLQKEHSVHKMQYYLWDFGGQDMYRLLHQLFVSEQAVYVIVTDTDRNKNEEEIDFWLETIQRLGKDKNGKYGPVILLQNPKTDREGSSFPDLKKRYKDLWRQQEDFIINLDKIDSQKAGFNKMELTRFQHFKNYLENSFHQIDHVGQVMPRQWVRIRKTLAKLISENWITLEKFRTICEKEFIKEKQEQDDLLKIFQRLGFVLHYDTGLLKGMIILNNEWATDALYRVLDDEIVKENKGWFLKANAKEIWHDKKYQDRENELLLLMQEFKLIYYNQISNKYIVPSKLPEDTEGLPEWNEIDNVRLHLRYDWLPRPIATQLIVLLHNHIVQINEKEQWIWRKGAVLDGKQLDFSNAQVRIMDNWRERQIEIHARGKSSEMLIRTIMQKWREVNEPYEDKVAVSKIILCNCEKCAIAPKPFEFDYQEILDAREANESLKCNKSRKEMKAEDILRGLFDETTVLVDTVTAKTGRSDLLNLIADGKIEEVLNNLPNTKTTLNFKSRYKNLIQKNQSGILRSDEYQLEWNRLNDSLILFLIDNRSENEKKVNLSEDSYRDKNEGKLNDDFIENPTLSSKEKGTIRYI